MTNINRIITFYPFPSYDYLLLITNQTVPSIFLVCLLSITLGNRKSVTDSVRQTVVATSSLIDVSPVMVSCFFLPPTSLSEQFQVSSTVGVGVHLVVHIGSVETTFLLNTLSIYDTVCTYIIMLILSSPITTWPPILILLFVQLCL